jgi:hypothetical protein
MHLLIFTERLKHAEILPLEKGKIIIKSKRGTRYLVECYVLNSSKLETYIKF